MVLGRYLPLYFRMMDTERVLYSRYTQNDPDIRPEYDTLEARPDTIIFYMRDYRAMRAYYNNIPYEEIPIMSDDEYRKIIGSVAKVEKFLDEIENLYPDRILY